MFKKRLRPRQREGLVNLFALMQYQGKGETVSPLYFPQAARAGTVISCQIWNRFLSS